MSHSNWNLWTLVVSYNLRPFWVADCFHGQNFSFSEVYYGALLARKVLLLFGQPFPQHGANVKITTPSTNHSTAKINPYPKNSRKLTRAMPATITYQNGATRFPM